MSPVYVPLKWNSRTVNYANRLRKSNKFYQVSLEYWQHLSSTSLDHIQHIPVMSGRVNGVAAFECHFDVWRAEIIDFFVAFFIYFPSVTFDAVCRSRLSSHFSTARSPNFIYFDLRVHIKPSFTVKVYKCFLFIFFIIIFLGGSNIQSQELILQSLTEANTVCLISTLHLVSIDNIQKTQPHKKIYFVFLTFGIHISVS